MKAQLLSSMLLLAASPAFAALNVTLSPSVPTAPVGTTITWTATVHGDPDPTPSYEYQFTANLTGTPTLLRRGYSPSNTYLWTPNALEGAFSVGVTVKNTHANTSASQTASYRVTSLLPAGNCAANPAACAAVNPTNHPLVALFTGTSCLQPNNMVVFFKPTTSVPPGGITALQQTTSLPCRATATIPNTTSMNFYVAGMYPNTTYEMYYETINPAGHMVHTGPTLNFTTGAIPSNVYLPTFTPSGTSADLAEPILLHSVITIPNAQGHIYANAAVDLAGNVLWYTENVPPMRTEIGGDYTGVGAWGTGPYNQGVREVDLAGNTVLEMSTGALSEQLVAAGQKPIVEIHHEFKRIYANTAAAPNNYFVLLGASENVSPTKAACTADPSTLGAQGGTCSSPVDIFSDQVIVLNSNLGLAWNWDETQFFDLNQTAFLNEQCLNGGGGGCPPITAINWTTGNPFTTANDWTHTNSVQYTPYDGNFLVSSRHQDVVYKVNYGNGSGDGHVMWELGPREFNDVNGNPTIPLMLTNAFNTVGSYDLSYPWNSHQHDAKIEFGGALIEGARILTLFDDGNDRFALDSSAHSRCLLYAINENALWANLNVDSDVGTYSFALGSNQILANGSMSCDSGYVNNSLNTESTENPITGTATVNYSMGVNQGTYRSFRMSSLYNPVP
jgi:arylsulfate sulfotransferase